MATLKIINHDEMHEELSYIDPALMVTLDEIKTTKLQKLNEGLVIVLKVVALLKFQNNDLDGNTLRFIANGIKVFDYQFD